MRISSEEELDVKKKKAFTMYEGWDAEKEKEGRSTLVEKVVFAGMDGSRGFPKRGKL